MKLIKTLCNNWLMVVPNGFLRLSGAFVKDQHQRVNKFSRMQHHKMLVELQRIKCNVKNGITLEYGLSKMHLPLAHMFYTNDIHYFCKQQSNLQTGCCLQWDGTCNEINSNKNKIGHGINLIIIQYNIDYVLAMFENIFW